MAWRRAVRTRFKAEFQVRSKGQLNDHDKSKLGVHPYADYHEFIADVTAGCERVSPGDHDWKPDLVIGKGPLRVQYEAMWKDEDDFLDVVIESTDAPVTMGRLLYKLHNESVAFFHGADHCWLEGLQESEPGVLWLRIGS